MGTPSESGNKGPDYLDFKKSFNKILNAASSIPELEGLDPMVIEVAAALVALGCQYDEKTRKYVTQDGGDASELLNHVIDTMINRS